MQIHQLQGYIQTIYLVEYPHGLVLLDGCCRCDVKTVLRFISEQLNRPVTDLKWVIVSHMHPDHAGGASAFRKVTGCKVATGAFERHWYRGVGGWMLHKLDILLTFYVARRLKKPWRPLYYPYQITPDLMLTDNMAIPDFAEWVSYSAVGHTDRDVMLLHRDTGHLYVADTLVKVKGRLLTPFPVHHPNQYKRTIAKLVGLKPQYLMLAHTGIEQYDAQQMETLVKTMPSRPSSTSHFLRKYLYRKLAELKGRK